MHKQLGESSPSVAKLYEQVWGKASDDIPRLVELLEGVFKEPLGMN